MSQTPAARTPAAGSPAPRPAPINLESIYTNIPILIQRVRNGQLVPNQIPPLRNLIANHAKDIIIFHARLGRTSPLVNLPDVLNPTKRVNNSDAITTEAAFLGSVQAGLAAASKTKPDPVLIAAMAAKQQAARPATQAAAQPRPPAAAATAAATPAASAATASPGPSAGATAASSAAASPKPEGTTPTTTPAVAAAAVPPMSLDQVRALISLPAEQRNVKLEADQDLKRRFFQSYQFFQRKSNQIRSARATPPPANADSPAASAAPSPAQSGNAPPPAAAQASTSGATATPSPAPASAHASSPSVPAPTQAPTPAQATPTAPAGPSAATTTPAAAPVPPPPQRPPTPPRVVPPPPPPEPENIRRKRKLREYTREIAPDLQLELGMDDVFSDVLDNLVEAVTRDSVRLAAHRGSSRVEVRDAAFVLEHYHDIVVPGFNAQIPKRVHLEAEGDRKRGRTVAPRRGGKRDDE